MKILTVIQGLLAATAAILLLLGIGTTFYVFPEGIIRLTVGGIQRMADTFLLFSIAIGVFVIARKKIEP